MLHGHGLLAQGPRGLRLPGGGWRFSAPVAFVGACGWDRLSLSRRLFAEVPSARLLGLGGRPRPGVRPPTWMGCIWFACACARAWRWGHEEESEFVKNCRSAFCVFVGLCRYGCGHSSYHRSTRCLRSLTIIGGRAGAAGASLAEYLGLYFLVIVSSAFTSHAQKHGRRAGAAVGWRPGELYWMSTVVHGRPEFLCFRLRGGGADFRGHAIRQIALGHPSYRELPPRATQHRG